MRILRSSIRLLALMLALVEAGCAQPLGLQPDRKHDLKTIASVGDKPLPVITGTPGDSLRVADTEPDALPPTRGHVSGRVYDRDNRPVANARVRLGVGGDPGGRAISTTTDRSGAFTLKGLKPGRQYTLIAEYQGDDGMMTGRVETEAPDVGVRISLHARDAVEGTRTTIRPSRPNVAPVSNLLPPSEADEEEEESVARPRSRANVEDLDPPAPEADDSDRALPVNVGSRGRVGRDDPPVVTANATTTTRRPGWSRSNVGSKPSTTNRPRSPRREESTIEEPRRDDPDAEPAIDDEGPNPLPPAIERPKVSSIVRPARQVDTDRQVRQVANSAAAGGASGPRLKVVVRDVQTPRDSASDRVGEAEPPRELEPVPETEEMIAQSMREITQQPEPSGGSRAIAVPTAERASPPSVASGTPQTPATATPQVLRPFNRPRWGDLASKSLAIPIDETVERITRQAPVVKPEPAVEGEAPVATEPTAAPRVVSAPSVPPAPTRGSRKEAPTPSRVAVSPAQLRPATGIGCEFDREERRLIDFRLPDATGRLVSFRDFDADLVLLDFWGTWCAPCRTSIPHLIEIQDSLGRSRKVQVIGIACEKLPANKRANEVESTVRKLGINYPVLISGNDGDCPVQDAFQIQFYPTMILMDRNGQILRREQGATQDNLARMDRFITRNLTPKDARRTLPPRGELPDTDAR